MEICFVINSYQLHLHYFCVGGGGVIQINPVNESATVDLSQTYNFCPQITFCRSINNIC